MSPVLTFFRPESVSTALQARALANEPPLPSGSNIIETRTLSCCSPGQLF